MPQAHGARELVSRSLVIDGCQFAEGDFPGWDRLVSKELVTAISLTVPNSGAGFREACRAIGELWRQASLPGIRLAVVRTPADIRRAKAEGKTAIILAFQHWEPIENSLAFLHVFHQLGVRIVQIAYNEAGYVGSGCVEQPDTGLTRFGRRAIAEMNRIGVLVDLSHVGDKTCRDVIEASTAPVVFTHVNPRRRAPNPRNKDDDLIKAVAAKGGVIGLSPWGPICWLGPGHPRPNLDDFVGHLEYLIGLVGYDHVSFGSDISLDGSSDPVGTQEQADRYPEVVAKYNKEVGPTFQVRYPVGLYGATNLVELVERLLERGHGAEDVQKFLGGNLLRVFEATWSGVTA